MDEHRKTWLVREALNEPRGIVTAGLRPSLEVWAETVAAEEEAFWREVEERRASGLPQLCLERRDGFAHPPVSIEIHTSILPMSPKRPYVSDTEPTQEEKAVGEAVWRLLAEAEGKA